MGVFIFAARRQLMSQRRLFTITPMTETHARSICDWRYDAPYDIYNSKPWAELLAGREEWADDAIRGQQFRSILDESGELCAFAQFFPLDGLTRLGIGMRPDLCGKGLGTSVIHLIVSEAKKRAPSHLIDLEVLSWNDRAYRAYEKAGFNYEQTYERMTPTGLAEFHCMVYDPRK
jgi:ribosomal-protein-alanine N-acetyltransferase